jgi:LPXTG-motif cell wall-anchored protein
MTFSDWMILAIIAGLIMILGFVMWLIDKRRR